jgi:pimeloyl-ACP methyl ester carboxylesterase
MIMIKDRSCFKDPACDIQWLKQWAGKVEAASGRSYQRIEVQTSLGRTHIWGMSTANKELEPLVIFPGARTSVLFWDLDKGLDQLGGRFRIYMAETNGLPNLSEPNSPDIKSAAYGHWAVEVLDALKLDRPFVAGASFGGTICMKLAMVAPERIAAIALLNPGCVQPFSLTVKNLYYNILPIVAPSEKNVRKFLDKAIFCKPHHQLSPEAEQLLVDYEVFALTRFKDKAQKPYDMDEELLQVKPDVYLIEGDRDLLFPYERSIRNAKAKLKNLRDVKVFENVGHGIETHAAALSYMGQVLQEHRRVMVA